MLSKEESNRLYNKYKFNPNDKIIIESIADEYERAGVLADRDCYEMMYNNDLDGILRYSKDMKTMEKSLYRLETSLKENHEWIPLKYKHESQIKFLADREHSSWIKSI